MDSDDSDGDAVAFQILLLVLLTLINAFFAGAEMAVVSVNKSKIRSLADLGNGRARLIEQLSEDSTKFLSTIQVAITLAGFFSSASAATGISQVLAGFFADFSVPYSQTAAVVLVTVILSYFTLVFGELVPKRVALQRAEQFALFTVKPIYAISRVLSPFIRLLSLSTNGFLHLVGMRTDHLEETVSEEEIKAMLETGSEAGVFNEAEKKMITSVFSFDDKTARDVMVPRREVCTLDLLRPCEEQMEEILASRHSRIPVYEGGIDHMVGVLPIRDFLLEMRKAGTDPDPRSLLREPFCEPDSKNADELFRDLQQRKEHMALLFDEYGGFSGIVTVEDLVEEVMGELRDEHEDVREQIRKTGENTWLLDGGVLVDTLNERLQLGLVTENYDTLSGFLVEKLDFIPVDTHLPVIASGPHRFTVLELGDKCIRRVRLDKG